MSWTVEYDDTLQIVVITYVGKSSGKDFKEAAKKRIAVAKALDSIRTLIDASKLYTDESTTVDVYNIVKNTYEKLGNRGDWKIAITTPESPTARRQVYFYETVCINRGWRVKEFEERKEAIEWLLKD